MPGIELIDEIVPKNSQTFPLVDDTHLRGGFRVVLDDTERDALNLDGKQKVGAIVYVQSSAEAGGGAEYYRWDGADWIVWELVPGSGSPGGALVGPISGVSTDNAVTRWNGTDASEVQDSSLVIDDTGNMTMQLDAEFLPSGDGQGDIGTDVTRWRRIRALEVVTGDLVMDAPERDASWRFKEHHEHIEVINQKTGKRYRLGLIPVEEEK